ncbi:hypothetical protein M427DRAFT_50325 [Gonapodya prolifera JEL478]|uniref:Uncharacterized protein n=1 Tax=Gonapodya prolifera (strain JEL478) TaxID=1344416 RepID=A0A138ZWB8_GONPJ|nr:hypothetical protein M427DRAFT_50325 [Gonapodya prolifera JEL478]|eukprot:KXS08781.1 hypothetical protein M427DRAFT_50325 [Gonapodya prolifera JEL478]
MSTQNFAWPVESAAVIIAMCVPLEVLEEKRQREEDEVNQEMELDRLRESEPQRRRLLEFLLKSAGLELRSDSRLCAKYITSGEGDLDMIVRRMSEMKWLFEYCNIRKVLDEVEQENIEEWEAGYIPDVPVFDEAEYRVLKAQPYPRVWPWMYDKYARIIQRGCRNWIWKPVTADGKFGISARVGMRACGIAFP